MEASPNRYALYEETPTGEYHLIGQYPTVAAARAAIECALSSPDAPHVIADLDAKREIGPDETDADA